METLIVSHHSWLNFEILLYLSTSEHLQGYFTEKISYWSRKSTKMWIMMRTAAYPFSSGLLIKLICVSIYSCGMHHFFILQLCLRLCVAFLLFTESSLTSLLSNARLLSHQDSYLCEYHLYSMCKLFEPMFTCYESCYVLCNIFNLNQM